MTVSIQRAYLKCQHSLVLHKEGELPDISPTGKVAGVKQIEVSRPYKEANRESFIGRTFNGLMLIQVARLISYGLLFIFLVVIVLLSLSFISERVTTRNRRILVSEFKQISRIEFNQDDDYIFQTYINNGDHQIQEIEELLSNEEEVKKLTMKISASSARERAVIALLKAGASSIYTEDLSDPFESEEMGIYIKESLIVRLMEVGFIQKTDSEVIINEHMKKTLQDFIKFLRARKKLKWVED